jgi:hypothetical protein
MLKAARVAAEGRELSCENANRGVNNPEPVLASGCVPGGIGTPDKSR